jgi:signal peptidase I
LTIGLGRIHRATKGNHLKPEAAPFWAVLAAFVVGITWWWLSYDSVAFDEPKALQFHVPMVEMGATRFGRRAGGLRAADLELGMLVRFKSPRVKSTLTGRVVAIEGQRVSLDGQDVYVDGAKIKDEYRKYGNGLEFMPELIVPEGCVFVLNDKRGRGGADRFDSRNLGPIPVAALTHRFSAKKPRRDRLRRR